MVNERVKIRDKHRVTKKVIKVLMIIFAIVLILLIVFAAGFLIKKPKIEVYLENPLARIVLKYTDEAGITDKTSVIEQGIIEFNEDYINYILVALGVGYLHKSPLFQNPLIEFDLAGEVWNSEIIKGMPDSKKGQMEDEDLRISISKEEAVEALLASNIEEFMKQSVDNGNTNIEMVAGKTELFSKGYLEMYKELTGEEIKVDE